MNLECHNTSEKKLGNENLNTQTLYTTDPDTFPKKMENESLQEKIIFFNESKFQI